MGTPQVHANVPHFVPDAGMTEMALKCNRKPVGNGKNVFPYHRFSLYMRLRMEQERWQRLSQISAGCEVMPLEDKLQEGNLRTEFAGLYGELDPESAQYGKIFNTYKEGRIQEIKEWEEEEQLLVKSVAKSCPQPMTIAAPDFSGFTSEELSLFASVSRGTSTGKEWLMLPRKRISMEEIVMMSKKPINLAQFDPELSTYEGCRLVPPQESNRDDRGVAEKLAVNIYSLICQHPTGIVASQFLYEYKQKFSYYPDFQNLGYHTISDFLADLNHIVFTQGNGPHNDFVLYPSYLENLIAAPMDIMWRIYHKLISLLKFFNGMCKTDDLVQLYESVFHVQIPIKSWGFSNADEFVAYLVNNVKWRSDRYMLKPSSIFSESANCPGHFVIFMTKERQKMIEQLMESKSSKLGLGKEVDFKSEAPFWCQAATKAHGLIHNNARFVEESLVLKPGMTDSFKVVRFVSPTNFELVRVSAVKALRDTYGPKWSTMYKKLNASGEPGTIVNPKFLVPGLPVVIFRDNLSNCVRGKYLGPDYDSFANMHRVKLVDEGGELITHEADIHYMLKEVLADARAQTITAGLKGFESEECLRRSKAYAVQRMVSNYALDLLCPVEGYQFVKVKFNNLDEQSGKWLVSVMSGSGIEMRDVLKELQHFCQKHGVTSTKSGPVKNHVGSDRNSRVRTAPIQMQGSHHRAQKACDSDMNWRSPKSPTNGFHPVESSGHIKQVSRNSHVSSVTGPLLEKNSLSACDWRHPSATASRVTNHKMHVETVSNGNNWSGCRNPRTPISYIQATTATTRRY